MDKDRNSHKNLPAKLPQLSENSLVKLDAQALAPIRKETEKSLSAINAEGTGKSTLKMMGGNYAGLALLIAWVNMPLSWPALAVFGLGVFASSSGGVAHKQHDDKFNKDCYKAKHAVAQFKEDIKTQIRWEQKQAYKSRQETLLNLAEDHLKNNDVLDIEILPELAALPPALLKEASDELAVTVLQIRAMMTHIRNPKARAEERPMTFKRLSDEFKLAVTPQRAEHRTLLRRHLEDNDRAMPEDRIDYQEWPLPDLDDFIAPELDDQIKALAGEKKGFLRLGFESVRDMYFPHLAVKNRKNLAALVKTIKLPDEIEFEVPALKSVEGVLQSLERYETEVEPLDLPAVRGWGKGGGKAALPSRNTPRLPI